MRFGNWAIGATMLCMVSGPTAAMAAATDPAGAQVESFYSALTSAMKSGSVTPAKLRPTVEQTFNIQVMAQYAVGAPWATMTPAERAAITASLTRYVAARYARDFATFNDQQFVVDPAVQARGEDRLVKSEVRERGEAPEKLYYRLRLYNGGWRAIDVFYNGISETATQRADFASSLASGGAAALVRKLDEATAKLK